MAQDQEGRKKEKEKCLRFFSTQMKILVSVLLISLYSTRGRTTQVFHLDRPPGLLHILYTSDLKYLHSEFHIAPQGSTAKPQGTAARAPT
jgi:hypothetical protein